MKPWIRTALAVVLVLAIAAGGFFLPNLVAARLDRAEQDTAFSLSTGDEQDPATVLRRKLTDGMQNLFYGAEEPVELDESAAVHTLAEMAQYAQDLLGALEKDSALFGGGFSVQEGATVQYANYGNGFVLWGIALSNPRGDTASFLLDDATGCVLALSYTFSDSYAFQIRQNDLWDYLKGSDGEDRLGPERACAQGWITPKSMRRGIAATTLAACAAGCGLIAYGGWWLIAVGAACVLFAFLYTAGPYPLAYHGWGDMLVLLFFGFVPVGCTYYVLCGGWTWQVAVVAAACGLVIDTLLMVNNYRDREQDARSGKRTLVVRLGERAGQRLYLLSGFAAAALCLGLWGDGRTWAALLPLLYLPPHVAAWRRMVRIGRGRELNAILGARSRNILLFGLLLTLGLLL